MSTNLEVLAAVKPETATVGLDQGANEDARWLEALRLAVVSIVDAYSVDAKPDAPNTDEQGRKPLHPKTV